jgi:hypothetical protein
MNRPSLFPLIISTLLFVGCVGGYVFFEYTILSLREHARALALENATLQQTSGVKLTSSSDYNELCKKIAEHFVSTDDPTPLLKLLESIAEPMHSQIVVKDISVNAPSKEKPSEKVLRVVLEVDGTWSAVHHTLFALEKVPYTHTLERAVLAQSPERKEVWKTEVTLVFDTLP